MEPPYRLMSFRCVPLRKNLESFVDRRLQPLTSLKAYLPHLSRLSNLQHLAFYTISRLITSYYPHYIINRGRRDALELAVEVQRKRYAE